MNGRGVGGLHAELIMGASFGMAGEWTLVGSHRLQRDGGLEYRRLLGSRMLENALVGFRTEAWEAGRSTLIVGAVGAMLGDGVDGGWGVVRWC